MASHTLVLSKPSPKMTEEEQEAAVERARSAAGRLYELGLRLAALSLTLAAAVVVGVDRQTKIISISIAPSLPTIHFPATAKWNYMSAFVYFVVSNGIACSYAAVSLCFTAIISPGESTRLLLGILDAVMVGLLFSAGGASAAIGIIARDGNSHVHWNKVCDVFSGYCNHMTAALVLSLTGSSSFLCLVVLNMMKLHKNPR